MLSLFNQTALECSKLITERYSTSFTLGIKTLDKKYHLPIYAIYGFVRYADEIVDTFHDFDKQTLLDRFRADAYLAIEEGISLNPILHSFQMVVRKYNIERELIDSRLRIGAFSKRFARWIMRRVQGHRFKPPGLVDEVVLGMSDAEATRLACAIEGVWQ